MTLDRTNRWLLGTSIVLLSLTGLRIWQDSRPDDPLFVLPPLQDLHVRAVEYTSPEGRLRLERGERWAITAPRALSADPERVAAFLRSWSTEFTPDLRLRLDDSALEPWGLDPASRGTLRLEGDEGPLVELYVGRRLSGGSRFLARPGDKSVYRGRIPGGHLLDPDPEAWRDNRLFPFDKDDLAGLRLEGPEGVFEFARLESDERAWWTAAGSTDFEPSSRVLDGIARSMANVEASATLEGESAEAARAGAGLGKVRVVLSTEAGVDWTLALGGDTDGGRWAAIEGDPRLFKLPLAAVRQLEKDRGALRDRTVLRIDRSPASRITFTQGEHRLVLAAEGERGWAVIQPADWPASAELDLAANSLVNLQGLDVIDGPHPQPGERALRLEVEGDTPTTTLHLVPDGDRWLAFDPERAGTFVLRGAVLDRLLRVFGAP